LQNYTTYIIYNNVTNEDLQVHIEFTKEDSKYILRLFKPAINNSVEEGLKIYGISEWSSNSKDEILQFLNNVNLKLIVDMISRT